jgi:carbonic anhydrase/acetyltransferase-like protein (isoleucine patch superfamily)
MAGQIVAYKGILPRIDPSVFLADGARIVGDVEIGADSSVWFNCVMRGDVHRVRMGRSSNLQDGSVVHVTEGRYGTFIGDFVLIGHMCLLHGCTLEDGVLIGMGSTVMDDVVIGQGAMIGAGSLVTPGKRVPPGQLWAGRPATYRRDLSAEEIAHNRKLTLGYVERGREYMGRG